MVYQEIEIDIDNGKRAFIVWDHPIRSSAEAVVWTVRMRRAADPTYVMEYLPALGVWCEVPHARR